MAGVAGLVGNAEVVEAVALYGNGDVAVGLSIDTSRLESRGGEGGLVVVDGVILLPLAKKTLLPI